jgi:biopolymer transport protein ExbD
MARVFKRKDRLSAMSEINITSLLDLVFCLLIIFMITTPLLEQTMPVKLPEQSRNPADQPNPKVKYQSVTMNAQGEYFFGAQKVSADELLAKLQALAAQPDPPVIDLRRAASLTVQQETDLFDLVTKSGLKQFSLDTQVR